MSNLICFQVWYFTIMGPLVNKYASCPFIMTFQIDWCRKLFTFFMEAFLIYSISVNYLSLKTFPLPLDETLEHPVGWLCLWTITSFTGFNCILRGSCHGSDSTFSSDHSNHSLGWNVIVPKWLIWTMFPKYLFNSQSVMRIHLTFWPNLHCAKS